MTEVKSTCASCGKTIEGQGVTFDVRGKIFKMCSLIPCASNIAAKLNEEARWATRPQAFGLPEEKK